MGWKQHTGINSVISHLFPQPGLCCCFSGAGSESRQSTAHSHGSSAAIWARCALPRKAQSVLGDTALPGAATAEEQSSALPSEQLYYQQHRCHPPEEKLPAPTQHCPTAPMGAPRLAAHEGQTAPVMPRPSLTGQPNSSFKD